MAEPINLNRLRKAKAKAEAKTQAAANRTKFGRTGAQKQAEKLDAARKEAALEGSKREN